MSIAIDGLWDRTNTRPTVSDKQSSELRLVVISRLRSNGKHPKSQVKAEPPPNYRQLPIFLDLFCPLMAPWLSYPGQSPVQTQGVYTRSAFRAPGSSTDSTTSPSTPQYHRSYTHHGESRSKSRMRLSRNCPRSRGGGGGGGNRNLR